MAIPYYSIVIPTHCRGTLLRRAIESVHNGGFEDYEIIVVSDVMDHETMLVAAEVLKISDTFIKRTGTPGPATSRNIGISLARGERIVFLDDDDAFQSGYLGNAHAACVQHPKKIIYATQFSVIEEDRSTNPTTIATQSSYSISGIPYESIYVKNFINCNASIYPSALVKTKTQDPSLGSLEDWDFMLSAIQDAELLELDISGPITFKDYINLGNRRGSSATAKGLQVISDYLSIYKKWPAPTAELKQQRQDFIAGAGFRPPLEWL